MFDGIGRMLFLFIGILFVIVIIAKYRVERLDKALLRKVLAQHAILAIDDINGSCNRGADHRCATEHGFEKSDGHALELAAENENV